jgi:hypothetical protein
MSDERLDLVGPAMVKIMLTPLQVGRHSRQRLPTRSFGRFRISKESMSATRPAIRRPSTAAPKTAVYTLAGSEVA